MKSLTVDDLKQVSRLNKYDRKFSVYVRNCLMNPDLPKVGVYRVAKRDSLLESQTLGLELVGCAMLHAANMSIGAVAVNPQYRGYGIASALMYRCAQEMFEKGFEMTYVNTWDWNHDARKFFTKIGYIKLDSPHYWIGSFGT